MKQLKNYQNETLRTSECVEGLRVIVVVDHETINTAIDAADVDLEKILINLVDESDGHTVFSGQLKKYALGSRVSNLTITDIVDEIGKVHVVAAAAAYERRAIDMSVMFNPYKGKLKCEITVQDLFHVDCDASSCVYVDFDYSDEAPVLRDYFESYDVLDGHTSDSFDLGNGVLDVAFVSFTANANEYTDLMELAAFNLSSDSQSINQNVTVTKMITDTLSEDSTSKHSNLILHTGELLNNVKLHLDYTEANIVAAKCFIVVHKAKYSALREEMGIIAKEKEDSAKIQKIAE